MRVAVTGGAGFIGANLCRELLTDDTIESISVLDDFSTGRRSNLDALDHTALDDTALDRTALERTDGTRRRLTIIEGSILDDTALDAAISGNDAIVHLAAVGSVPRSVADPMTSFTANATGTTMVLEAARRHGGLHTIVAGSSSVYGSNPTLPKHEDLATRPLSPYGVSKLATEAAALAWASSYDLPTLAFRFFNVFGPMQPAGHVYAAVIPAFVDAALRGDPVTIHGDGSQSRDFTYVGTVTATIAAALRKRVTADSPINLAFGSRITLLDVLDRVEHLIGHAVERTHVSPRAGDVPHSQADNSRLLELLPDLTPVSFDDGLAATVEWMRSAIAESSGSAMRPG